MSVINQVLNQLEARGTQLDDERLQVRPVALPRKVYGRWLPGLITLLILLAVFTWRSLSLPQKAGLQAVALTPVAGDVALPTELSSSASRPGLELRAVHGTEGAKKRVAVVIAPVVASVTGSSSSQSSPVHPKVHASVATAASQGKTKNIADSQIIEAQPMKSISPAQQAEVEFRKALVLMQQGRSAEALSGYRAALQSDAKHDAARQALVALLLESQRSNEAEQVLQDGRKNAPEQIGFAMILARLQIQRGELDPAIATLENGLPQARQQAEYQAFYAALLQRKSRHREAVEHYQIALKSVPDRAVWLMGYGLSLQALARTDEAREAYQRALDSSTLSPELQSFVRQKLEGL